MLHDIESYIITIRRKGSQVVDAQHIAPVSAPRMKPLDHEYESSELHELQASYSAASGNAATGAVTEITAPLPGIIIDIKVHVGDSVSEGRELAVLEAMKMENSIEAPCSGTVKSISVAVGDTVSEGTVILTIE